MNHLITIMNLSLDIKSSLIFWPIINFNWCGSLILSIMIRADSDAYSWLLVSNPSKLLTWLSISSQNSRIAFTSRPEVIIFNLNNSLMCADMIFCDFPYQILSSSQQLSLLVIQICYRHVCDMVCRASLSRQDSTTIAIIFWDFLCFVKPSKNSRKVEIELFP